MSGKQEHLQDECPVFASIIIPSFNPGELIFQTLRSCCMIHDVALEIIVVDDGSTDGTPEMIERKFPKVRLHRLARNSGSGSVARNVGLSLAKGRYIKFIDHDDLIQPRGFKKECCEAMKSNADIVMGCWGVIKIDQQGRPDKNTIKSFRPPHPDRLRDAILLGESVPYTGAALYKRSYLADESWDPTIRMIDDFDWFCRMAFKGGVVKRVDTLSYYWRQHDNSLQSKSAKSGSIYRDITGERYRVYKKLEIILRERQLLNQHRRLLLARRYYDFLRWCARYDRTECVALQRKICELEPGFIVDRSCEPRRLSLLLSRTIGLAAYFRLYGWFVRLLRR